MENSNKAEKIVVVAPTKSVGISLLLTFFFGPLGMLYSTVVGALVMLLVSGVAVFLTLGISIFFTQPICMIWGAMAAHRHNKKIIIQ
ncbi:hypothetical protein PG299_03845 [Riemerella anatipestifer]|nr:hypothetical protein [Riemerella anatipestifer]